MNYLSITDADIHQPSRRHLLTTLLAVLPKMGRRNTRWAIEKTTIFLAAMLVGLGFASLVAFAQPQRVSPDVKLRLDAAEAKLTAIESALTRIEDRKVISQAEATDLDKMRDYAEDMKTALDGALEQARKAASSQGREGDVGSLKAVEDTAKAHQDRAKRLNDRLQAIKAEVKKGRTKLDKGLLQRMTPAERDEFKGFLDPEGRREMERTHPDLFPPGGGPAAFAEPRSAPSLNRYEGIQVARIAVRACGQVIEKVGDLLIPRVEAAAPTPSVGYPCFSPCWSQDWGTCGECIVFAAPGAYGCWNNFQSCWNGAAWWCWWCKGWCVAVFLGCLA